MFHIDKPTTQLLIRRRLLPFLLGLLLLLTAIPLWAQSPETAGSAAYIHRTVKDPQVGSVGGEWAVLGLARSGAPVPASYYSNYYRRVEEAVLASQGVLHQRKYTEYARVSLSLTAMGADPRELAGYNLLAPLGDFDKTIWQGINGPIWALIALDAGNYPMPLNPEASRQASRQLYLEEILSRQLADGGFSLSGLGGEKTPADPDITAMALLALSPYRDDAAVAAAVERALTCLSLAQKADGGFESYGVGNAESTAMVLMALCQLGIDPEDGRFVKGGGGLLSNLLSYRQDDGSFRHVDAGGGDDQMASEVGLCALAALDRFQQGKNSFYDMSDALPLGDPAAPGGQGLPGKHAQVQVMPLLEVSPSFLDVTDAGDRLPVEALAARGILSGKGEDRFDPHAGMTRAEYTSLITRGLGLPAVEEGIFKDVAAGAWYAAAVDTAWRYGIASGLGQDRFAPEGTISRQEAAAMVVRAAGLCGLDTELTADQVRNELAVFADYRQAASWAQPSLAYCYRQGLFPGSDDLIQPQKTISRLEIARAVYRMLTLARLI